MCKIPVILLGGKGARARRQEIELPDFDPRKHQLLGSDVCVTVSQSDFHEKVSEVLKGLIGGRMNMSFGKSLKAVDPGSAYPVYRVEVKSNGTLMHFWLPKTACDLRIPSSSIRKSSGVSAVA
ncbi:MAG: hypothetical protein WC835_03450 [Candidatus Paceibacterota bacterium]|jgi:hypothetical protein